MVATMARTNVKPVKAKPVSVYQQIKRLSLPLIEHYHDDLLKHDLAWLRNPKHRGVPFLHWTRDMGTDLAGLFPTDHEAWPKAGELKPYLFGKSKREHFLRHAVINAQCRARWTKGSDKSLLVLYFDGVKLKQIDCVKAVGIAEGHERRVLREWGSRQCSCGSCGGVDWR